MKFKSMKSKLAFLMIAIIIIVALLSTVLVNNVLTSIVENRISNEAKLILDNLRISTATLLHHENSEDDIAALINQTVSYELIEKVSFCNSQQKIIVSSEEGEEGLYTDNMCVSSVATNHKDFASYFDVDNHIYEMAMPVSDHESLGIIYLSLDSSYIDNLLSSSTTHVIITIILIQTVVLIAIFIVLNFQVIRPLKIINASTEKVIKNDFNSPLELNRNDEFDELEKAYNKMLDHIKRYMEHLENDKKMAVQSSQEKMNFLARMSHEIRTPLNSIIGFSSLLLERNSNIEDKKELNIIINASNHLVNVVNDILDITKMEQHQLILENEPYSMRRVMEQISAMFEMQIKNKGLTFEVTINKNVPTMLFGDSFRIKEIIINLMGNALKFTEKGSIKVVIDYELPFLSIAVTDTGVGIPEEKKSIIFEPFEQSDETVTRLYGGTGLGLAISKRIAQLMGGDIHVISDGKTGSTFTVVVESQINLNEMDESVIMVESWISEDPEIENIIMEFLPKLPGRVDEIKTLVKEQRIEALQVALHAFRGVSGNLNINEIASCLDEFERYVVMNPEVDDNYDIYLEALNLIMNKIPSYYLIEHKTKGSSETTKGDLKLLLAEDVIENRYLVKMILQNHSVAIDEAKDGEEVIKMLLLKSYDVLLLDIQMPIKSGIDVLNWINDNSEYRPKHVIALSANARREDMERYMSLGCTDYLSKPIDKELLRNKIGAM